MRQPAGSFAPAGVFFVKDGRYYNSPSMAMPPTIVVAATVAPAVMMATTAHMAMTMTAPDLDDGAVGAAESIRCCRGHSRRCSCRSQTRECSKSNKCKFQFHGFSSCDILERRAQYESECEQGMSERAVFACQRRRFTPAGFT
jgi:hypothetical protein